MAKSIVAVLKTKPETVIEDYEKLMKLADFEKYLAKDKKTILKNNISWHLMMPGANTTPWQMEGTIKALKNAGYNDLVCVQNNTVVNYAYKGEKENKYVDIYKRYNIEVRYNFESKDMNWIVYEPKGKMLVLDKIFPDGIKIPDYFIGKNVIHQPTVKCHIYTQTTGAMKNAFGGLLDNNRHYCHSHIHETLVDLLRIQKEILTGIFAVMDGTTSGNGPGPRTMKPICKNVILASNDCVAIDAVAAKMMGFEPMKIDYIRIATEEGLGTGIIDEIEIRGYDIKDENWHFYVGDNAASKVGDICWFGPLKFLQHFLFHTPIVNLFIFASAFYHDKIWYPLKGKKIVNEWYKTEWGKLFLKYK